MNWYYVESGEQRGPVSDTELLALAQSGRVGPDTLIWREGMAEWQAYQTAGPTVGSAAPVSGQPHQGVVCHQCGRVFPPDEVVTINNTRVCATCKPVVLQKLQEGVLVSGGLRYAGFWIRAGAKVLDSLIIGVPFLIIGFLLVFWGARDPEAMLGFQIAAQFLYYAAAGAYSIFFVGKYGATPGKMICRLRVVTAEGGRVTYPRATGRFFAEILSGIVCYIGYIIAAFDDEKRTLHDHIASTRVVVKQPS